MNQTQQYDIILWGASGFTGQLVAEYLLRRYGAQGELRWAMAGRSKDKLEQVKQQLGEPAADIPLLLADSSDRASLDALVNQTKVIITTVGPYALYGSELVAACLAAGTDYCDLTGEVPWIRRMLDEHQQTAADSQARIVHCCGFDSIPSDMGVWFLQRAAMEKFGQPLERIKLRVKAAKGGISGGTYASMLAIGEQARRDKAVASILKNPYAICPPDKRKGPRQPYVSRPHFDRDFNAWTAPFVMAAINTRIVNRSNALSGHSYGENFTYDEAMLMGKGFSGRMRAASVSLGMGAFLVTAAVAPGKALLKKFILPKPGEGPSKEQREAGFFKLLLWGKTADGQTLKAEVTGDRDPGYGSTCKMITEAAVCLSQLDKDKLPGGFYTPSTALGQSLLERLETNAGLSFTLKE